jgi:hypothetical protein
LGERVGVIGASLRVFHSEFLVLSSTIFVIPGLDPGISWRRMTRRLQSEVLMSPDQFLKGDTRIKSGYDEEVDDISRLLLQNALS